MTVATHAIWTEGGVEVVLFLPFVVQLIPVAAEGPSALLHPPIPMRGHLPVVLQDFHPKYGNNYKKILKNYSNYRNYGVIKNSHPNLYVSLSAPGVHISFWLLQID